MIFKNYLKLIFSFIIIVQSSNTYSQRNYDLNGFSDFKFGVTKKEVIEDLKNKLIKYDTIKSATSSINNNFVYYTDRAELPYEDVLLDVTLFFDKNNNNKLYEIIVEAYKDKGSFSEAKKYSEEFIDILLNKYGDYDSIKNLTKNNKFIDEKSLLYGTYEQYYWMFVNGYIKLNFYIYDNDYDYYNSNEIVDRNGFARIQIKYVNTELYNTYIHLQLEEHFDEMEKKREILNNKF